MPSANEVQLANPVFEIDQPEEFSQFLLTNPREIAFYLQLLAKQRSIVTVYLDDGRHFFLSSIVAVDLSENLILLDPSHTEESNLAALAASRITLVATLDRVKMQVRLSNLKKLTYQGQNTLSSNMPGLLLRLQRREFFRLEPPLSHPIQCKLATTKPDGSTQTFELTLSDISGGGVSLIAAVEQAANFPRDALFQDCRLEISGEGVIQVNLRVRKTIEISSRNGEHSLRVGCEFVNLTGTKLAFIERYITRIERERKARDTGLSD